MTTTKLLNYSISENNSNDKLFKKQRFNSHLINPLDKYNNQLLLNLNTLKKKFPSV
jgi:hypothetical protein